MFEMGVYVFSDSYSGLFKSVQKVPYWDWVCWYECCPLPTLWAVPWCGHTSKAKRRGRVIIEKGTLYSPIKLNTSVQIVYKNSMFENVDKWAEQVCWVQCATFEFGRIAGCYWSSRTSRRRNSMFENVDKWAEQVRWVQCATFGRIAGCYWSSRTSRRRNGQCGRRRR